MAGNTSARHVFATLREVCSADEPLGVTEIRRRVGLSPSSAQRALLTLTQAGYVKRLEYIPRYRVGPTSERLANAVLERFKIRAASLLFLRQLAATSRRTASLYSRLGWYSVRLIGIEAESGRGSSPRTRRPGEAALLTDHAASLAILAHLPQREIDHCLRFSAAHVKPGAAASSTDALVGRLTEIRAGGYVYEPGDDRGRNEMMAFPVRDPGGTVLASLAIEGSRGAMGLFESPLKSAWQGVVRDFEAEIRSKPQYYANPFAHLDPDQIRLGTAADPG